MNTLKLTYIYALIDPRDDQVRYIGKANNPKSRYINHFNSSRDKNTHKRNWINNIRKDGYRPELLILDEVLISEWKFWECYYISLFKTFGFKLTNSTDGGDGSTFGNIGTFRKGLIPHNKGIPRSEVTKKKISESLTGGENPSCHKKVIQYDLNYEVINVYKSMTEASKGGIFSVSKISRCCRLRKGSHKNYIWRFGHDSISDGEIVSVLEKPVIQLNKNGEELNEYVSIKEASKSTGIFESNICACCKGRVKTSGGYIWVYKK